MANPNQYSPAPQANKATSKGYDANGYDAKGYTAENYSAKNGSAASYNADQRQVNPNATVQGQMSGLLADNGKYMQAARSRAAETANSRGLLNSSMAVGAGERAAIESAMPIAQQDAGTYSQRALANMSAGNQKRRFNAGNQQQMTLNNVKAQNQAEQYNAQVDNRAAEFGATAQNRAGEINAQSQNRGGEFAASSANQTSQFNTGQSNNMAQAQWTQQESQRFEEAQRKLTADLQESQIDQEAAVNLRGEFVVSYESISNEANINISEIQTSTDIPGAEKSKMIDQQMRLRDADLLGLERIYEAQPQWQQNWSEIGSGDSGVISDMVAEREAARQS